MLQRHFKFQYKYKHSLRDVFLKFLERKADVFEDFWREQVNTAADQSADESARFFDIMSNLKSAINQH